MKDETLIQRSLLAIKKLRAEIASSEGRRIEPIAVTGMACRFPGGANSPDEYWKLLASGRNAISRVSADRWSADAHYDSDLDAPGKTYVVDGGFLGDELFLFDPGFFSISDAETREMDPQHRLLLTTSWEALESAALPPERLPGRRIGVYVGAAAAEYATLPRRAGVSPYTATGSVMSVAVGRISHTLGLNGPALAIDTACSSSLVAVHLAIEALRRGEIDAALVGGVNALLSPAPFIMLSKMRALSPDGRCKVFDEMADGYVRAEGCGMIVLRRLGDAQEDGSPILAAIRGSAINHDGHGSGVTAPNGAAQRRLITDALETAGLEPEQVTYLEAHGTGTSLGDPIEIQAAVEAYAAGNARQSPLLVGSAKSAVGHLEAAAGVAGLIKTIMILRRGKVPPNLHLNKLNPRITSDASVVRFPTKLEPWSGVDGMRNAGVSSFGFNGTNAHVIVSEPSIVERRVGGVFDHSVPARRAAYPLVISARDGESLCEAMRRLLTYLSEHPGTSLPSLCRTMGEGRVHHKIRYGFKVTSIDDAVEQLTVALREKHPERTSGGNVTMVFGGALHSPLAIKDELAHESVFADTWNYVSAWMDTHGHAGFGVVDDNPMIRIAHDFGVQLGIARLWNSWGIRPAAVMAEGDGDLPAAVLAGLLDMDEALALIVHRYGKGAQVRVNVRQQAEIRFICADGRGQEADLAWHEPSPPLDFDAELSSLVGRRYRGLIRVSGRKINLDSRMTAVPGVGSGRAWDVMSEGVAQMFQAGWELDWSSFFRTAREPFLNLPTYPFSYKLFRGEPAATGDSAIQETLPGTKVISPLPSSQFEARVNHRLLPEIADTGGMLHVGYYSEMIAHALRRLEKVGDVVMDNFEFIKAFHISAEDDRIIQLVITAPDERDCHGFEIHSRPAAGVDWELHAQGRICTRSIPMRPKVTADVRETYIRRCQDLMDGAQFYQELIERGFEAGESVRLIEELRIGEGEVLARLAMGVRMHGSGSGARRVSPGLLDACAQMAVIAGKERLAPNDLFITVEMRRLEIVDRRTDSEIWCHLWAVDEQASGFVVVNFDVFDDDGNYVVRCQGMRLRIIPMGLAVDVAGFSEPGGASFERCATQFLSVEHEERRSQIHEHLSSSLADLLGDADNGPVPTDVSLAELGLDSLAALELRRSVKQEFGVQLPLELLVQGPTVDGLADSVSRLIDAGDEERRGRGERIPWHSHEYSMDSRKWLAHSRITSNPRVRVFCIPYGIKGASLYASWKNMFSDDIDVCPVQFPGKEGRIDERPIADIDEAVIALEKVLDPYLDRPYALYGHSVGALVAFRLAHRLACRPHNSLRHLFVGAYSSPSIVPNPVYDRIMESIHAFGFETLPDVEELIQMPKDRVKEYERYIGESFGIEVNDEMRDALKPVGYSDFKLVHTYTFDPEEGRLAVPVTAYHGDQDSLVAEDEMRAWKEITSAGFSFRVLAGDHFFLHHDQSEKELLDDIDGRLRGMS